MHAIIPDPQPPADMPRGLHEICEDARRGQCGLCCAMPGEPCAWRGPGLDSHGYHLARFAWAEAHELITVTDFDTVLETIAADPFGNATVIYDDQRRGTVSSSQDMPLEPLGPFETSSDALLAVRPADGSFTGREDLFGLLKDTMHDAEVELHGWDWTVLRWLAGLDVQTVAAIAGWVGRANGGLSTDLDGAEPYCAECGHWIGMFFGLDGWQHFRGDPAPGGQRQLFDAGHEPSPAWCQPPGRAISPADAVIIRQALDDAERARRADAAAWCDDCQDHPVGACDEHVDDLDQADAYADLTRQLQQEEDR
jgi:hypothetical protein